MGLADEALLKTGVKKAGKLVRTEQAQLEFQPSGSKTPIAWDLIQWVERDSAVPPPLRAPRVMVVRLFDRQKITGDLRMLDKDKAVLRTSWSDELAVPRNLIQGIEHLPGLLTFHVDDFSKGFESWKVTGQPELRKSKPAESRQEAILFKQDQMVEYKPRKDLAAGIFGINFSQERELASGKWLVELAFDSKPAKSTVGIQVAGNQKNYPLTTSVLDGVFRPVEQSLGWHRLTVHFTKTSISAAIDDRLIWYSQEKGPAGTLQSVRLRCIGQDDQEVSGSVAFADLALSRLLGPKRKPIGDPDVDEVWLTSGDQLFGHSLAADQKGVTLKDRFGKQEYLWGEIRGIYPKETTVNPQTSEGEQVRLWLRPGGGREFDELSGVLTSFDDKQLTLDHPHLGKLKIDQNNVVRLARLFVGRRIEIDNKAHHLGDPGQRQALLRPVKAEGGSLQESFKLERLPVSCDLLVTVLNLQGPVDGIEDALKRGELRSEVVLNGQLIDYLNRHVDKAQKDVRVLTIRLSREVLKIGDNELIIRQTPERDGGRCRSVGIQSLAVELRE
jgi:hypothetical protein